LGKKAFVGETSYRAESLSILVLVSAEAATFNYYSANIKGDIKQLNSLWDGESKDLMAWRRIPSSAYRQGSRASRLSMPE
jgi:hypothetical protein